MRNAPMRRMSETSCFSISWKVKLIDRLLSEEVMDEKTLCTPEIHRKKTSEYGEWVYIQKMKFFHERFGQEFEDHRDYFSNMALHDSYEEEHIADKLHTRCNKLDCLIDKRRAEIRQKGFGK